MTLTSKLLMATGRAEIPYIDDVFSTYLYTGNGSTNTIINGIDLIREGGLVWIKDRNNLNGARDHFLTAFPTDLTLRSNLTNASEAGVIDSNSNGFSIPSGVTGVNENTLNYASWTFRKANAFFDIQTVTKVASADKIVDLSTLGTIGMVAVKRTDSTGSWYVWHRSATAGKLLYLEQTAAEATLGHITVSGTDLTLEDGVIADGDYIVYAWAHDTEDSGFIQCGTYSGNSGINSIEVGNESQFVLIKRLTGGVGSWVLLDIIRGMPVSTNAQYLIANGTQAETTTGPIYPIATGFEINSVLAPLNETGSTYIYIAIRRPNKPPVIGGNVYHAITRVGTGLADVVTGIGFNPDVAFISERDKEQGWGFSFFDRLRGTLQYLDTSTTDAEGTTSSPPGHSVAFGMNSIQYGADYNFRANADNRRYINYLLKRVPGFFDEVCDVGTGVAHTIDHSLGVVPELLIRRGRSGATQWEVYSKSIANTKHLILNSTAASATDTTVWDSTTPTASVFTVGTGASVNTNTATYVTYLFASLPQISKVGGYVGNGSGSFINCNFVTGAKFVLIKRIDSTGNWWTFDSVRGIVAGNDPHLSLNTTTAEATDDSIDPAALGFIVNQNSSTNINVSDATYIYLAIA